MIFKMSNLKKYSPFLTIFFIIIIYTLIVFEFSKPLDNTKIPDAINDFVILLTCLLGLFFVIKIIENRAVGRILIWGLYLIFLGLYSVFLNDFYEKFVFLNYFSVFDVVAIGLFLFVYGIAKWAKIIQENDKVSLLNKELLKKTEELSIREKELIEYKENLDKTNKNLENKNKELQKTNKSFIRRELDMINLKKEVNDLLKQLNKKPKYNIN